MNKNKTYISTQYTNQIQDYFNEVFPITLNDIEDTDASVIRNAMFAFFSTKRFKELYFDMASSLGKELRLDMGKLVLQTSPTPRVFKPNTHATSFHCDYWYGHGLQSYTVWTPLMNLDENNTFHLAKENKQDELYDLLEKSRGIVRNEEDIIKDCFPVMPDKGSSAVFNTTTLHGSPLNKSTKTRLSFDFRLGISPDETSTKDLENYYKYNGKTFEIQDHPLKEKKVLKYICGGKNKNTFSQHSLIEQSAERYKYIIDGQEAETERFGHPVLEQYLDGLLEEKGFSGIVIASSSIIDDDMLKQLKTSKVKTFAVLDNQFLNC